MLSRLSFVARRVAQPTALRAPRPQPVLLHCFSGLPDHEVHGLPALSPTMEAGTIASWNFSEGDAFEAGSVLAEIETDKATMGFEAQDPGVIAKILVPSGVEVKVGTPVVVVVDEADDPAALVAAFKDFTADAGSGDAAAASGDASSSAGAAETAAAAPAAADSKPSHGRVPSIQFQGKAGWAARRAGGGSSPAKAAAAAPAAPTAAAAPKAAAAPTAAAGGGALAGMAPRVEATAASTTNAPGNDVAATTMRKVIAKRLAESKSSVPHFYASVECELDNILAFRKTLAKDYDTKVSVNDLIIRCAGLALRDVPEMNASFDAATGTRKLNPTVDVSVAVATPGGLITPIVTNVDKRGLGDIGETVKELAGRARVGKLLPHEFQGGTFSVSNLGMFGVAEFSAVINPPQACIMAVGGGVRTVLPGLPIPAADAVLEASDSATASNAKATANGGGVSRGEPRVATLMTARVSVDRRVADEALAGQFLQCFKAYMSEPHLLML